MTDPFDDESLLEARLKAHAAVAVRPFDAMAITATAVARAPRRAATLSWLGPWSGRESRSTAIRIALVGLLLVAAAAGAVLVGAALRDREPFPDRPALVLPSASPSAAILSGPTDVAIRATWVANALPLPLLQNGAGPVSLTIDSAGGRLAVANFAPGAAFASAADEVATDMIHVVLDRDSGGCRAGAEGVYRLALDSDGMLLTLSMVSDACHSRGQALARTWARSLNGSSSRGAGIVDTMGTAFGVKLPDDTYEARTLDGFIEIGGSNGFSLMVFKNPQGFADSCSDQQVRYPYAPGAAAFVAYYRQNDAFTVVAATPITIDGHDAIHLVTKVNVVGARCPSAPLYALTPKDCNCHFFGSDDSLYLVDVGTDTFLFQLSPPTDTAAEMQIINSIRIPYELPTQ